MTGMTLGEMLRRLALTALMAAAGAAVLLAALSFIAPLPGRSS